MATFTDSIPALANQISSDIPKIEENFEHIKEVFENFVGTWHDSTPTGIYPAVLVASNAAGPQIFDEAATATNPTLVANKAEADTGIGWVSDSVVFIGGGAEIGRVDATGLGIGRTPTTLLDAYAASGNVNVTADSDSLTSGQLARFIATGTGNSVTASAWIGAVYYDQSGAGGSNAPAGAMSLIQGDADNAFYWTDNTGDLRTSATISHIGSTNGTVVGDQSSDERGKKNIAPIENGMDTVRNMAPVEFDQDGVHKLGFGAQTLRKILPEAVYDTNDDKYGSPGSTALAMRIMPIVATLTKALQEADDRIAALEAA